MFEWLAENMWLVWLSIAVLLVIVEITVLDLIFLMLAGGATAATVAALAGAPVWAQIGVGALVAIILLFAVRPVALRHLKESKEKSDYGVESLPGQQATVVEPITDATGQVRVDGEVWSARTSGHRSISPGDIVHIERVDGAVLWVSIDPPLTA